MTYEECLSESNKFMDESGIRKYCREICNGGCCGNDPQRCLYAPLNVDRKNITRADCNISLKCVLFVCNSLRNLIVDNVAWYNQNRIGACLDSLRVVAIGSCYNNEVLDTVKFKHRKVILKAINKIFKLNSEDIVIGCKYRK